MIRLVERMLCNPRMAHSARMNFRKEMIEREIKVAFYTGLY